jgi:TPR repeat protein
MPEPAEVAAMSRILVVMLLLPVTAFAQEKGTKYAFIVAVSKYDEANGLKPLPFTVRDVEGFRDALILSGYEPKNIRLLHDRLGEEENPGFRFVPKKSEILTELARLLKFADTDDSVIVVLNGHGVHFKGDKTSHFCPLDADLGAKTNMIPMDGEGGLYPLLEKCRAKRKLLIAGMCRNDPKEFPADSQAADIIDLSLPDKPPEGIAALYSCEPGQRTYFDTKTGSFFFKHLSAAWRGEYSPDEVTLEDVFTSVRAKTKKDVNDMSNGLKDQFPEVRRKYDGTWLVQPADLALLSREQRRYETLMYCENHSMTFGKGFEKPRLSGFCYPPKPEDENTNRERRFKDVLAMAKTGNPTAMLLAGVFINFASGTDKNEAQAAEWFRKAAELGNTSALYELGIMTQETDKDKSREYFTKAAELGNPKAMGWLSMLYLNGIGVERDRAAAVKWAVRAGEHGYLYSLNDVGTDALGGEDGNTKDVKLAVTMFRRAANLGSPAAMCMLGALHLTGEGVEKDEAKALAWFRKAADLGDFNGMTCLGFCHEQGRGVEKSREKAIEWFRKAVKTDLVADAAKEGLKRLGEE